MNKIYLGDSVYLEDTGFELIFTTENGYLDDPRNKIVMEPEVVIKLVEYLENKIKNKTYNLPEGP